MLFINLYLLHNLMSQQEPSESEKLVDDNTSINDITNKTFISYVKDKLLIIFCIIIVLISGSGQAILIPLSTLFLPSAYFILLVSVIEINIIFILIMLFCYCRYDADIFMLDRKSILSVVIAGIATFLMCLIKVYASNPNRTSPIMQSTLTSTTLMFSVIFSKLLFKKVVSYNYIFIVISVIAICASVLMPFIYEIVISGINTEILWTIAYEFGVMFRGLSVTFQEKYFIITNNKNTLNKIKLLFYTNIIQIPLVIPCVGFDYIFGNTTHVDYDIFNSTKILFTEYKVFLLFHGFILSYFIFLGSTIWLNTISSNYVAVAAVIVTPAVTIFFQVFGNLVPGVVYPYYIIIPSLVLSAIGTLFWIFGEN